MKLKELQKHWDAFGKQDPMWAILTVPEKKNQKWVSEEFFQNGREEIAQILAHLQSIDVSLQYGKALDFGCGIGRLSQALAEHFQEVHGVDIAPSMIDAARQHNQYGTQCQYHLNETDNLAIFADDTFDFIYTVIVLQHMPPEYSQRYLREFLRILAPGGILIFQLPSDLTPEAKVAQRKSETANTSAKSAPTARSPFLTIYRRIKSWILSFAHNDHFVPQMEMHAVPKDTVMAIIAEEGATIIDLQPDTWAGPAWESFTYYVLKETGY